ncbi:MAG: hypothetical protein VB144_11450 [Clostridia bacterium]|nr:hypothetical protein [Clostridia bacterium]
MNLDSLMRIGIDATCAFAVMNIINGLRRGWFGRRARRWLDAPGTKRERTARLIALAWWVSLAVSAAFAARSYVGGWQAYMGEWLSRAIIAWLLSMGQFDAIKLAWPTAFGQKEASDDQGVA